MSKLRRRQSAEPEVVPLLGTIVTAGDREDESRQWAKQIAGMGVQRSEWS